MKIIWKVEKLIMLIRGEVDWVMILILKNKIKKWFFNLWIK